MIGPRHPSVQRLRRLSQRRRARSDEGAYVVDGPTLLDEALRAGVGIAEVVAEPGAPAELLTRAREAGAVVHQAREGTLARVVDTVHPQPVAAIARLDPSPLDQALDRLGPQPLVLVLVGVNDPGNAGTLLRSADAAGAELVILGDDAVDPYNPKCVRASAGALFRVPVVRDAAGADAIDGLRRRGVRCLGTVAHHGTAHDRADLTGPTALVLGSEAHGLPATLAARLDGQLTILMDGPTESLNVAMAGTVLCFEAHRQRRRRREGARVDDSTADSAGADDGGTAGASPTAGRQEQEPNPLDATEWPDAGCSAA